MPAYNTNDMVRTIIELQKLVFDLQTEIRSNHSQVNDLLDAMEERLIGGSVTDMTPRRVEQMTEQSAVRSIARFPGGKIPDTGIVTEKGKPNRISDREALWEFLLCVRPDLCHTHGESQEEIEMKDVELKSLYGVLRDYAKSCITQLNAEVQSDPVLSIKTWGMHSRELKMKYILALEALARRGKIGLDQCLNHWGAERLLASFAHNTLGDKSVEKEVKLFSDDEEIIPPGLELDQPESFSIPNEEQSGRENDHVSLEKDTPLARRGRKRKIVNN